MSDIVLSAGVRQNLLALQTTAKLMTITQNRLATGKNVNTALDNPVNYFTASALQSRAGDFSALLDAMGNGVKTLQAADNGLTAIGHTLESMQSTLLQARQDRSFQIASYGIDNAAIGMASLKNLTFAGGSVGATPVNIALNTLATTPPTQASVTTANSSFTAPTPATQSLVTAANVYTNVDLTNNANDTLSLQVTLGANSKTITLDRAHSGGDNIYSIGEAVTEIQRQLDLATALPVTVATDGPGTRLVFTANTAGATTLTVSNISIVDGGGGGANQAITDLGISNPGTTGQQNTGVNAVDRNITINGTNITLTSANASTATAAAATINAALTAASVTATGNNANGKIDLAGATDGSNSITITGPDANVVFGAPGTRTVVAGNLGSQDGSVKTVDQLVAAINAHASLIGKVEAANDNGKLQIQSISTSTLTLTGISGSGLINGGAGTATIAGNTVRANLATQFNDLRDQLNKLAQDASFNGINLLNGDSLKVVFNETATSTVDIQAKDAAGNPFTLNATNLSIALLIPANLDLDSSIDGFLATMKQALNVVRSQASNFGSYLSIVENRQDFTKAMINTLETGADNLVLADTNEEGANMLALQTRQQLSTTALSLAAQADQGVLRLFG